MLTSSDRTAAAGPRSQRRRVCAAIAAVAVCATSACRSELGWDRYIEEAYAMLVERQEQMQEEYRLGEWERFDWDQGSQELVLSHEGVPRVIAKVQFVGSLSNLSNTWRWAWANDSIQPGMKADVLRVKQLGAEKGWQRLTEAQWPATEQSGWEMTAVALRVLDARGAYRSPDENGLVFMVITDIRWATAGDASTEEGSHRSDERASHRMGLDS